MMVLGREWKFWGKGPRDKGVAGEDDTRCSSKWQCWGESERTGGRGRWTKEWLGRTTRAVLASDGAGEGVNVLGELVEGQRSDRGEGRGNKEEPGLRGGAEKRLEYWNKGILISPPETCWMWALTNQELLKTLLNVEWKSHRWSSCCINNLTLMFIFYFYKLCFFYLFCLFHENAAGLNCYLFSRSDSRKTYSIAHRFFVLNWK